jgi:hypothetical protein
MYYLCSGARQRASRVPVVEGYLLVQAGVMAEQDTDRSGLGEG